MSAIARWTAIACLPVLAGIAAFVHASRALTDEGHPSRNQLCARTVDRLPQGLDDPAWSTARPLHALLVRQNAASPSVEAVDVRALLAGSDVAFRLEWEDGSEDRSGDDPSSGSDAVAIQFPLEHEAEGLLPSVLFGDPSHPVRLWIWSPRSGATEVVSSGPASFQATKPVATGRVTGEGAHASRRWAVALRGRLDRSLRAAFPLAVFVWDGSRGDADATTSVSGWRWLVEDDPLPPSALLRGLAAALGVLLLEWALVALRRPRC